MALNFADSKPKGGLGRFLLMSMVVTAIVLAPVGYRMAVPAPAADMPPPEAVGQLVQEDEASFIKIDAKSLQEQYSRNRVRAEAYFNGQVLVVTGVAIATGTDLLGAPFVLLGSDPEDLGGIQFSCDKRGANEVGKISVGSTVTMGGRCVGNMFGSVLIEKSFLLENNAPASPSAARSI